jgi:hypothetical protein
MTMKTLITMLLACCVALSTGLAAKEGGDKKAVTKSKQKAPHVNAAPHVKAAPHTAPSSHVKVNRQPSSANLTKQKVHKNQVTKQQLHKSPAAPANKLPAVQSQKHVTNAQTNQINQINKKVVAPNTKPIPNAQTIQAKYRNFKAQPKPAAIASAQFNQNYRIAGAQNWSGQQYQVFSSYHPQWHDQGWWQANYAANLLLIAGGWYYWNSGYWYPAWGYDTGAAYYPYDGPIYTGETRRPFDEVVADVQASLQEQGYYRGDVDGLMGPLTRQALADFQRDHGLVTTAALDQPTLSTLGLG